MTDSGTGRAVRDTAALVGEARRGSTRAMEELLAAHLPLVYGIVGRALNGHADVDDLVQEVMLRIVRALPSLREPERFRSWAVAIAYREIQQYQRRTARERFHGHEVEDAADPLTDFAERTVAELELSGQRRDLARAARWLDPEDRRLLALWWEEEAGRIARADVASALGLNARHTAVRVRRMKMRLEEARTVVRALAVAPRCPGLADAAQGWDGGTGALWRKRLTRHVRGCPQCGAQGTGLVPPEKLLPGLGLIPVPGGLVDGVRHAAEAASLLGQTATGGIRGVLHQATAKSVTASAAVLAVVAGALTYPVWHSPAPSPSPAPPCPAGRRITLSNYRGERPVIDASGLPGGTWAVTQEADNWTVQGLEIRGSASHAYVCRSCRNTVFRGLSLHDNAESGLTLRDAGTENNTVLDSDFYANGPGEAGRIARADVASALGLNARHTAVRVRRMKMRLEEARTVVRALAVAPRCPGLADAAQGWDGGTGALWRKRLTRHVRGCPQCGAQGTGLVPPEKLLPGLGLIPVPGGLVDGVRHAAEAASLLGQTATGGIRGVLHQATAKSVTASAAVLAVVAGDGEGAGECHTGYVSAPATTASTAADAVTDLAVAWCSTPRIPPVAV
nr:sigma-70 family RNA polymerase sigma factor [Streptomyces sp. QL37]PPQ59377.1 hypothetical protein C5F59_23950 [Streptomyces sp. QL37]